MIHFYKVTGSMYCCIIATTLDSRLELLFENSKAFQPKDSEGTVAISIAYLFFKNISVIGLCTFEKQREKAFVDGFSYWNDGGRKMESHEQSTSHLESVQALERYGCHNIEELLDKNTKQVKLDNKIMLAHVVESVKFLARQNLPLRGATHVRSHDQEITTPEPNSNVIQTLCLLEKYSNKLSPLLKRKKQLYISKCTK